VCGISGYTHWCHSFTSSSIREATDRLWHRGPDQQGTFESEFVSLGAVRLKIIDLAAGDQPFSSDNGDTVLVFNGEIYNYGELRKELEVAGHHFRTHSDTEVFLHAFLEWDTDCFRRMRGMFAAALWTESERRLILVRDRLGIKPLYIHRKAEDIYFGSELKSIFAHPEIPRQLDLRALHHYLALNYVPGPFTLIQGIEKLPPGCVLQWKSGKVSVETFWKPSYQKNPNWTEASAEESLDELLRNSMRDHMISDVPLGIWLSGGLDSSALLHYARAATSGRLKTFSISFQGRSFDESRYIREVAAKYDTEHHELDVNPSLDLAGAIEELAYYSDEPFADAGAVPVWFLSKLTRQTAKVALSGEGADELFGGYITYRADHLAKYARYFPKTARRLLLSLLRYWPVSDDKISLEYKIKRFMEGSMLPEDEAHVYWNGSFTRAQQSNLLLRMNHASAGDLFGADLPSAKVHGQLSRYLAFDQRYYLADDLLQKVDRMSMAHSLEVRPPYLDHRIVEFAASLPENFKIRGRQQKAILKNLMKGKLPASVLQRPKNGLDIPTHDWLRGTLRELLQETLSPGAVRETMLFCPDEMARLIRDHLERRANLGFHLWGLLILFLWIKYWNIQTGPELTQKSLEAETVFRPA